MDVGNFFWDMENKQIQITCHNKYVDTMHSFKHGFISTQLISEQK